MPDFNQMPPPGGPMGQATGMPMAPPVPPKFYNVTIKGKRCIERARVTAIAPEEFGISRRARNIPDASYCFHEVIRRQNDLIGEGYDDFQIRSLPTYTGLINIETQARDTVEERRAGASQDNYDVAIREVKITEHYVRMDYEQTGKAPKIYRCTTGGEQADILIKDGEPDIIEVERMPFAAITPFIITHRFFGRSIADAIMDIQRIKTVLLRGLLDNVYARNNPRTEIAQAFATDTTLDDVQTIRFGGVIRTKQPGGVNYLEIPDVTQAIYPAIQYMDATREWRTGVSRQGQGVDPNALQNQVATIANQMFTTSQQRVKLIARIFAETGIRDMFQLLHWIIRKNGSQKQTVRLRNQWVEVDPREWKERQDMAINVGLGTGTKNEQLVHMNNIIQLQTLALQNGKTNLVNDQNLFNSAKEITRLVGLPDAERFFSDPTKQPPPQPPAPPPQVQVAQLKAQQEVTMENLRQQHEIIRTKLDATLQQQKMQSDAAHQVMKTQADQALAERRFQLERELAIIEGQIQIATAQHDAQLKAFGVAQDHVVSMAELAIKAQQARRANGGASAQNR